MVDIIKKYISSIKDFTVNNYEILKKHWIILKTIS